MAVVFHSSRASANASTEFWKLMWKGTAKSASRAVPKQHAFAKSTTKPKDEKSVSELLGEKVGEHVVDKGLKCAKNGKLPDSQHGCEPKPEPKSKTVKLRTAPTRTIAESR